MGLALALAVTRRVAEFDRRIRAGERCEKDRLSRHRTLGKDRRRDRNGQYRHPIARKYHAAFNAKLLAYDPYALDDHWPDIPMSAFRLWMRSCRESIY